MRRGDRLNAARRHGEQRLDQAWAMASRRLHRGPLVEPYDGDPRIAIVTVNRSTTPYLKLMLATLADQHELSLVRRIVIVDHASRDGGDAFARELAAASSAFSTVANRHFLNHARGIRSGLRALEHVEQADAPDARSNIVLFCDPDVVFRDPDALISLASVITVHDAAVAGELRQTTRKYPDIQASFLAVRRDWLARRDIAPWVNHGSPSLWLQESVWDAGGVVVDFPSNLGGYVLHRGRAAVAASREFAPRSSYATASPHPHYMGVPDGERIWAEVAARYEWWLDAAHEDEVVRRLAERFTLR
jgi:hypothetical protein